MSGFQNLARIGNVSGISSHDAGHGRSPHGSWIARGWRGFTQAVQVALSRRDLAEMDDRMLKDLGISRAQAQFEAGRAPWHVTPAGK